MNVFKKRRHTANSLIILIGITFFLLLVNPQPAWAYLDPGSGSYLAQVVIASLLSLGFLVKTYWAKIKKILARLFKKTPSEKVPPTDEREN